MSTAVVATTGGTGAVASSGSFVGTPGGSSGGAPRGFGLSRRTLLLGAGALAVAVGVPVGIEALSGERTLDLLNTSAELFARHVGSTFHVGRRGGVVVVLTAVEHRGERAFSLIFDGAVGLGQGIQDMRHGELGRFDLFLVPGAAGLAASTYEAAFNHYGGTS